MKILSRWVKRSISQEVFRKRIRRLLRIYLNIYDDICMRCNLCASTCPSHKVIKDFNPRKRVDSARRVLKGEYKRDDIDLLFTCLLCGSCKISCPFSLDIPEIVYLARSLLALEGEAPEDLAKIYLKAEREGNSFGISREKIDKIISETSKMASEEKPRELYVPGPLDVSLYEDVFINNCELLKEMRIRWTVSSEAVELGGNIGIDMSRPDLGLKILNNVLREAEKMNIKKIIIGDCGADYKWLIYSQRFFPDLIYKPSYNIEFVSIYELFMRSFSRYIKRRDVAIHDPCSMTRIAGLERSYLKLFEKPNKPLNNGLYTLCCGAGGGLSIRRDNDSLSKKLMNEISCLRFRQLIRSSEDIKMITSPCIKCLTAFLTASLYIGYEYEIEPLSNILLRCVKNV
jgi:glycolate oxidase iron-sulfur subunit